MCVCGGGGSVKRSPARERKRERGGRDRERETHANVASRVSHSSPSAAQNNDIISVFCNNKKKVG